MISTISKFDENMSKNLPYYNLLLKQTAPKTASVKVCEYAAVCAPEESIISKICEGYQFIIAFSGKLYNTSLLYEKLAAQGYCFSDKSDAELALFSYIHFGKTCPGLLCGSFAFIVYDSMRRCLFCATDVSSSVPLFYRDSQDSVMVSSAVSGIAACPDFSAETDASYIKRIICPSINIPSEIFSHIKILPPSHFLEITPSGVFEFEYAPCVCEPSPEDIIKEFIPLKHPPAIVYTGSVYEEKLLELLFENGCNYQPTVYSCNFYSIFKKYALNWQKVTLCEESVMASLEHTAISCVVPYILPGDIVLSLVMRRFADCHYPLFTAFGSTKENYSCTQLLIENGAFHQPVAESLSPVSSSPGLLCNAPCLLGSNTGVSPVSPFLREYGGLITPEDVKPILRKLLLYIISKDTSPVFAFFKPGALLSLYEGSFDFSQSEVLDVDLLSYIIKLDIWFRKYRPRIL